MSAQTSERLSRARISLEGLSIGDAFGEMFFVNPAVVESLIEQRAVPADEVWHWTDDSLMAFSVFENLREFGEINQDRLAESFARHYHINRGYGAGMHQLLQRLRDGENWRNAAASLFAGQGSFGNGSAMRVAPVGAFFADDLNTVVAQAAKSAVVTHAHDEAAAGAIAVAVAAALAWQFKQTGERPNRNEFIESILPFVPESEVKTVTRRALDFREDISVRHVAAMLGSGSKVSCPDTVPFCLFCAGEKLDDFASALWLTAAGLGDRDTTCAIVGGIVVSYTGAEAIPQTWRERHENLPEWVEN